MREFAGLCKITENQWQTHSLDIEKDDTLQLLLTYEKIVEIYKSINSCYRRYREMCGIGKKQCYVKYTREKLNELLERNYLHLDTWGYFRYENKWYIHPDGRGIHGSSKCPDVVPVPVRGYT